MSTEEISMHDNINNHKHKSNEKKKYMPRKLNANSKWITVKSIIFICINWMGKVKEICARERERNIVVMKQMTEFEWRERAAQSQIYAVCCVRVWERERWAQFFASSILSTEETETPPTQHTAQSIHRCNACCECWLRIFTAIAHCNDWQCDVGCHANALNRGMEM